jgi:hypothetical protein
MIFFDVWFKEKVDQISEKNVKGLLQEAFKAGETHSTFNGRPGIEDALILISGMNKEIKNHYEKSSNSRYRWYIS